MEMRSEKMRRGAWRQASGLRRATTIGAALALLIGLGAGPAGATPKQCGDYVPSGSVYSCNLTPNGAAPFHDCLTVTVGGGAGLVFTMPIFGGLAFTCACDATGTKNPILFGSRSTFLCDAKDSESDPFALSGKLVSGGRKIVSGNMIAAGVLAWAFSCNLDPECTP